MPRPDERPSIHPGVRQHRDPGSSWLPADKWYCGAPISPHVCKEVRDRGLMWKDFGGVRRGEELVLWGAINAANYRYIQEYTFRDAGVITARMGATGQNLPGAELTPHAHNAIWRIDIDLNGVTNNAARLRHIAIIKARLNYSGRREIRGDRNERRRSAFCTP